MTQSIVPPFYKVFYKCDDQFHPNPPKALNRLMTKLVRNNLPHLLIQNRSFENNEPHPSKCIVYALTDHGIGVGTVPEAEVYCVQYFDDPFDENTEVINFFGMYNKD